MSFVVKNLLLIDYPASGSLRCRCGMTGGFCIDAGWLVAAVVRAGVGVDVCFTG